MFKFIQSLKGDKGIWSFVALLALFSFMPVFSASSNLAYMNHGTGNTLSYLVKHAVHIGFGFWILYQVQKIQVNRFKAIAILLLPFSWLLIAATYFIGVEQGSATRWLRIPGTSITFQPSTAAFVMLMMFVAFYLSRKREEPLTFKSTLINLWLPVGITLMLILPNNFSTAALIFAMVLMLAFTANYPVKYLLGVIGIGVTAFALFIAVGKFVNKTQPEVKTGLFHRVATWEKRLESFVNEDEKTDAQNDDYQIEKAKTAIATGGLYGLGPGKSVQKNFLPQSSSDFIFAIIVEEYGLLGGLTVLSLYMLLFLRFIITAHKAKSQYGKLLIVGLGFPIIFQALINMGVAVQLLPVTGQTLPLVSSGGSSIWMTFFAIGVILSATKKEEEFAEEQAEREAREAALQKLIDKQMEEERQLAEAEAQTGVISENKAVQT